MPVRIKGGRGPILKNATPFAILSVNNFPDPFAVRLNVNEDELNRENQIPSRAGGTGGGSHPLKMEPGRREGNIPGKEDWTPGGLQGNEIEVTTVPGRTCRERLNIPGMVESNGN